MPFPEHKKNVAVIGLGLLGASMAMALRRRGGDFYEISGWTRKKEVRERLKNEGILDFTADDIKDVISCADISVLCLPVPQIIQYCSDFSGVWKPGSIVTDVGSVKKIIVENAEDILKKNEVEFIGSHPMAGTEKSGADAAFPELYDNAVVFLTPTEKSSRTALDSVCRLWKTLNTRVFELGLDEHDHIMAGSSHVSHVVAWCLVLDALGSYGGGSDKDSNPLWLACSSGFRDVTRIASSSPSMWREIIEQNREPVLDAMNRFGEKWEELKKLIEKCDYDKLQQEFDMGTKLREDWLKFRYPGS